MRRATQDTFFWHAEVSVGDALAVSGSEGYGPHTRRDDVLFVGSDLGGSGIYETLSRRTVDRARRHYERQRAHGSRG